MTISNILSGFSRLTLHTIRQSTTRDISTTNNKSPLYFRATNALFGEPLKKKKRIDPAIIRNREERKKRKIEKQIRRLQKHAKQLKPIEELEIPFHLIDEKTQRTRETVQLSFTTLEERELLQKKWIQYKLEEHRRDMEILDTIMSSQNRALAELQAESEELYQAAIKVDMPSLLPHTSNESPLIVDTPPLKNYHSPDGNYTNITVKFDGE